MKKDVREDDDWMQDRIRFPIFPSIKMLPRKKKHAAAANECTNVLALLLGEETHPNE